MKRILAFVVAFVSLTTLFAQQGQYSLRYDAATQRYTVYAKVSAAYNAPQSRFNNLFVTIVAPTGAAATQFIPSSLATDAALASGNVVSFTRLDAPSWNSAKDYLFFTFDVGSGSYTPQNIAANTEFAVFSFQSQNGCLPGNINVIVHNDADYTVAQNNTVNASNSLSIIGAGGETYNSNYGTAAVSCTVACAANAGVLGY